MKTVESGQLSKPGCGQNQGVIQWLHWSIPLDIKFAWIGPWSETSLTTLV